MRRWLPALLLVALQLAACGDDPSASLADGGVQDAHLRLDAGDGRPADAGIDPADVGIDPASEGPLLGESPRALYLYRTYREDYGAGRTSEYISPGTTNIDMQASGDVRVYDRGEQLSDLWVSAFSAEAKPEDAASEELSGFQADVGWTIEAWFRAGDTTGVRPIFSDGGASNYALLIRDGRLCGEVRTQQGTLAELCSAEALDDSWHQAALVARVHAPGTIRLRLYRDQQLVDQQTLTGEELPIATAPPVLGARNGAHFDGEIHAAEMVNWPVSHAILSTRQLNDGSRLLGRPSFHNTLGSAPNYYLRVERTLADFEQLGLTKTRLRVPLLNDGFVPQGLALSEDGGRLYLGYYHRLPASTTCSVDESDSVVAEVDLETQVVTRIFRLAGQMHHVGGLAVFGDNLYVADSRERELERYSLRTTPRHEIEFSGDPLRHAPPVVRITPEETRAMEITPSTLDFDLDSMGLWVAEHRPSSGDAIRSGEVRLIGLSAEGGFDEERRAQRYCLPVIRVQGLSAYRREGELRFVIVRSYGHSPSLVYDWVPGDPPGRTCTDDDIESITPALRLPPGLEEVDIAPDGSLWTWSESGARYYQKRDHVSCSAAWTYLAPYVTSFAPLDR